MKIISKRGKTPEVDIELDLQDLDEDQQKPEQDEPQQEFEFYNEDWVIQGFSANDIDFISGLRKIHAWATHSVHEGVWTVYYRKTEVCKFTDFALCESDVEVMLAYVRGIIEVLKTAEAP